MLYVRVFEQALGRAQATGHGRPDDYVFLPELRDRQQALSILGFWFKWVLREAGMKRLITWTANARCTA